ncbi:MAG: hypothetical protein IT440_06970 [Phycisphaeraceae bacterium]|nr:hypothetical protein [Phycisphaeraceae bacterium]
MATSFGALCNDFYVNQKLMLKMDLPSDRETILHLFDRVRKAQPSMNRFRRYEGELALESSRKEPEYRWLAMRHNNIRTGHVNPDSMTDGYLLHRQVLEAAPFHLTISPLDVDYLELLFGFDLECAANHDEVVSDAFYADSPLGELTRIRDTKTLDIQPILGVSLSDKGEMQAYFEVKTRRRDRRGGSKRYRDEPISVLLTLRRYGPIDRIEDLVTTFDELTRRAEQLATEALVPHVLTPIARQITSRSA